MQAFFNRRGTQRKEGAENRKGRIKMKNDETHITSAALCGFTSAALCV